MPRLSQFWVYPSPTILATLNATVKGTVSGILNLSIEVFADLLAEATAENANGFDRKEWTRIAEACTERFEVSSTPIGMRLENCVAQNSAHPIAAARLAARLFDLSELRAWAVVWSLRTYQTREVDLAKDEWWTLKFRTATEGKGSGKL